MSKEIKLCKDCKWIVVDSSIGVRLGKCRHPSLAEKDINLASGERDYKYCVNVREYNDCGLSGEWFEFKEERPVEPSLWEKFTMFIGKFFHG